MHRLTVFLLLRSQCRPRKRGVSAVLPVNGLTKQLSVEMRLKAAESEAPGAEFGEPCAVLPLHS